MNIDRQKLIRFLKDLRRRRVVQVGIAYIIGAWVVIEVASVVLPAFDAPDFVLRATIVILVITFPIALSLSWYFDITPEGLVETEPMESGGDTPAADDDADVNELATFAERRAITVLRYSVDVRDADGDDVDPETLREVLPALHEQFTQVISQYGGHSAWDNQTEAEIYFGYPVALEHDARSAVRCALKLVGEIAAGSSAAGTIVEIGAGICSGVTVAEQALEDKATETARVTGKVLRVAARLLDFAPRAKVAVSASTKALLGEQFECVSASDGPTPVDDDEAWFVLREHPPVYDVMQRAPVTQLRGREAETRLLEDVWRRATDGSGESVAIVGDPGYGKSALVSYVTKKVADEDVGAIAVCQCSYLNRHVALHPVADLYRRSIIGLAEVADPAKRIELVEQFLRERNQDVEHDAPILIDLLRVAPTPEYPPLDLEPQEIKDRTLEFIIDSLFLRTSEQPVLLVMEDLHWSDATTRELLGRIIRRGPEARLCTVLTYRPEFDAPWSGSGAVSQVILRGLSSEQAHAFVLDIAAERDLSDALRRQIVSHSDGVPLFLEELTKAVLDSADPSVDEQVSHVPATLQETLAARLDRLGSTKRVAQMASVFGRDFNYEWITTVSEFEVATLNEALDALVASELLYQKGVPPKANYSFKHVLIQEAAYESLLKRDRKHFHERIAAMFEEEFSDWRQSHPQIVASHWARAAEFMKAATLYLESGNHALRRSAYDEAERQFRAALKQLQQLEPTAERKRLELEVLVVLGHAMTPTHGFFSKTIEENYERARKLSAELGEAETNYRINTGLWRTKIAQGRLLEAQRHAEETHSIAEASSSDVLSIGSCTFLGITDFHLGNFAKAEQKLTRVIELYGAKTRDGLAEMFGQDPMVTALGWYALARWLRGHSDEARDAMDRAIETSRRLDHAFTLAYTLRQSLLLHYFAGEMDQMVQIADELDELAEANSFAEMTLYVMFWRLVIQASQTDPGANVAGIAQLVETCKQTGVVLNLPYIRGALAEQYLAAHMHDDCEAELHTAIDEADGLQIQWFSAELRRLYGRLLADRAGMATDEAERNFQEALRLSDEQNNVFFGLRARLELARMYCDSTQNERAADMLTTIDDLGIDPGNLAELSEKNRLEKQLST